jgi:hypothetical protein
MDDLAKLATAHMRAHVEAYGVAALKVQDGHVLMFSRATLEMLLERSHETEDGIVSVFVKTGPTLASDTHSN